MTGPRVNSIVWKLQQLELGESALFELLITDDLQAKQSQMQTYFKRLAPKRFAQSTITGTEGPNLNELSVVRVLRVTRFE